MAIRAPQVQPSPPRRRGPPPNFPTLLRRLLPNMGLAAVLVSASLLMGACGYHYTQHLPWIDSLLNAAMILTGMGPVDPLTNTAAKLFATFYALFSGIVFLTTAALVLLPILHCVLHRFHIELEEDQSTADHRGKPSR